MPPPLPSAFPKVTRPGKIGTVVEYVCKPGFRSRVPLLSRCLPTLEWSKPSEQCVLLGKYSMHFEINSYVL